MAKQIVLAFVLGSWAILLAGCTTRDESKDATPPGKDVAVESPAKKETPAKADPREITFLVDGMTERLKLI